MTCRFSDRVWTARSGLQGPPHCRSLVQPFVLQTLCERISPGNPWRGSQQRPSLRGAPSISGFAPEQSGEIPDAERTGRPRGRTPPRQREGPGNGPVHRGRSPRRRARGSERVEPVSSWAPHPRELNLVVRAGSDPVRALPQTHRSLPFRVSPGRLGREPLPPGEDRSRPDRPGCQTPVSKSRASPSREPTRWVQRTVGIAGPTGSRRGDIVLTFRR